MTASFTSESSLNCDYCYHARDNDGYSCNDDSNDDDDYVNHEVGVDFNDNDYLKKTKKNVCSIFIAI